MKSVEETLDAQKQAIIDRIRADEKATTAFVKRVWSFLSDLQCQNHDLSQDMAVELRQLIGLCHNYMQSGDRE